MGLGCKFQKGGYLKEKSPGGLTGRGDSISGPRRKDHGKRAPGENGRKKEVCPTKISILVGEGEDRKGKKRGTPIVVGGRDEGKGFARNNELIETSRERSPKSGLKSGP